MVAAVTSLMVAGTANAQRLNGSAEWNYQNVDQLSLDEPQESVIQTYRLNYSNRLRGNIDLTAQGQFSQQDVLGGSQRLRNPQGSVRLAHAYWGASAAYLPTETRDALGLTNNYQNLVLTGYTQKPGLPTLAGSWIRSHVDPNPLSTGSATVTRNLSSVYNIPRLSLHGAYGDRFLETDLDPNPRNTETHVNLGATSNFQIWRAPSSLRYDFGQSETRPSPTFSQQSRVHTAAASTNYQFSPKTSSSLAYTYQRNASTPGGTLLEDHNGALALSHQPSRAVNLSIASGVRSVNFLGGRETEKFLAASAAAQGNVRTGWHGYAGVSRSINWLPGIEARPVDTFQSNTTMQLTRGLSARADLTTTSSQVAEPIGADTTGTLSLRSIQGGAGLTAVPLKRLYLDGSFHASRSGASYFLGGVTSTSYAANARLTPSPRLTLNGNWTLNQGFRTKGTTSQAGFQWIVGSAFQASGAYSRSRQELLFASPINGLQESYAGSMAMALARDLRGTLRYSVANPRQASEVRLLSAGMSYNFGR
jgi:hypothetical protein